MKKRYDLAVKIGEYNGKAKWQSVGAMIEDNGKRYMFIDRTFNPAGVSVEHGKTSILVSIFEAKEKTQEMTPAQELGFDDGPPSFTF